MEISITRYACYNHDMKLHFRPFSVSHILPIVETYTQRPEQIHRIYGSFKST